MYTVTTIHCYDKDKIVLFHTKSISGVSDKDFIVRYQRPLRSACHLRTSWPTQPRLRYQASKTPMSSGSPLSSSAYVVFKCAHRVANNLCLERYHSKLLVRTTGHRAGPPGCMRASCRKKASLPTSNPRLHVLQASAILYLCFCCIVEPAYTAKTTYMKSLQEVDIGLKQSPCLGTV